MNKTEKMYALMNVSVGVYLFAHLVAFMFSVSPAFVFLQGFAMFGTMVIACYVAYVALMPQIDYMDIQFKEIFSYSLTRFEEMAFMWGFWLVLYEIII